MRKSDVLGRAVEIQERRLAVLKKSENRRTEALFPRDFRPEAGKILDETVFLETGKARWSELSLPEKRKVKSAFLRKILSLYLFPGYWRDKTFESRPFFKKEKVRKVSPGDEEETVPLPSFVETESFLVFLKPVYIVGVHPSPEDFRPYFRTGWDKKRGKRVVIFFVPDDDTYESSRHYNRLTLDVLKGKKTEKGIVLLASYSLYRRRLEYGRWREFTYLFGIEDGSPFVDRVPYTGNIDEALEWMKPHEVKKAEEEGRTVLRQGDVFLVELKSKKKTIFDYRLPRNHEAVEAEGGKVVVRHHEHTALVLPHPYFKPVVRKTIQERVGRFFD